jgi:hypothetical protein
MTSPGKSTPTRKPRTAKLAGTTAETVAARAKQAGLRIRADADVDAIAARLRATYNAVSAWLATRSGAPTKPQAKATTKQPAKARAEPKQMKPDKAPTITLGHLWGDKQPDWLYRTTAPPSRVPK